MTARDKAILETALADWKRRTETEGAATALMAKVNPIFIPRNHRVEQVIQAATGGDLVRCQMQ